MPSLRFEIIICTYLPGFPVALMLYILGFDKLLTGLGDDYSTIFFIIMPLILGLFIDTIRHGVALILSKKSHYICIKRCYNSLFWTNPSRKQIEYFEKNFNSSVIQSYILDRLSILFHVFEFFHNLAISSFTVFILLLIFSGQFNEYADYVEIGYYILIAIIIGSLLLAKILIDLKNNLIKEFFTNSTVHLDFNSDKK